MGPADKATLIGYLYKSILAGGVSLGGWVVMFPLRSAVKTIKEKFKVLDDVKDELVTQRTNCLQTLQNQGEKQVELLENVNKTLQDIHTGQAEMSGYLKGQAVAPRPRRYYGKKKR